MGFFDERVLAALKDGKPRSFTTLLGQVDFSHNTLQQHLKRLMAEDLVLREKVTANGFGRPKFAYHVPSRTTKQVTVALQNPNVELVALPFSRLRHVCRFEKGGYCKETKRDCAPQICPPNQKIRIITTLHQLRDKPARLSRDERYARYCRVYRYRKNS